MPKCIKRTSGEIERVKDKVAEQLVKKSEAVYITKSEWRKADSEYVKRKPKAEKKVVEVVDEPEVKKKK